MFQKFLLILIQFQLFQNQPVALDQFASCKTDRYALCLCVVFNEVHDGMQASVQRSAVLAFGIAEVHSARTLLKFRYMKGMVDEFLNAFISGGRNRNDRNSKGRFQFINLNRSAVGVDLVHHIQRQNHRNIKLNELQRQVHIAFNIGRVHNVDNALWLIL